MTPDKIRLNAYTGAPEGPPVGELDAGFLSWALGEAGRQIRKDLKPHVPDPADWRDPKVGWGVVLPHRPGKTDAELGTAADAPEAIRELLAQRGEGNGWKPQVFRYHAEASPERRFRFLHNHRTGRSLAIVGSGTGVADHELPSYLLIAASPDEVPWELQYVLAGQRLVGRLDLTEDEGLENYVGALINGFGGAESDVHRSVTWAVVHDDPEDITHTLRRMITRKIHRRLLGDDDLKAGARFLDGKEAPATAQQLIEALAELKPALVVTSSHGKTGPLHDEALMRATLGLPVDQAFSTLSADALLDSWEPNGAVWLAHACCSAGSAATSAYDGLFPPDGEIGRLLKGVAALGNGVAPLPKRLLGHEKPLRAFIGQVEPTFDWTLVDPDTGQPFTNALCEVVYPRLFQPLPVGLALDPWSDQVDGYHRTHSQLVRLFDQGENVEEKLLLPRLAARDVESTVLLGDPTVMLPAL